jgi:hypothetical protein
VLWSFRGIQQTNQAAVLVHEYYTRRVLAELGYTSDADELSDAEVESFMLISSELRRLERDEMKRKKR